MGLGALNSGIQTLSFNVTVSKFLTDLDADCVALMDMDTAGPSDSAKPRAVPSRSVDLRETVII